MSAWQMPIMFSGISSSQRASMTKPASMTEPLRVERAEAKPRRPMKPKRCTSMSASKYVWWSVWNVCCGRVSNGFMLYSAISLRSSDGKLHSSGFRKLPMAY